VNQEYAVQSEWKELRDLMAGRERCTAYLLGSSDLGKSTLCRYLVSELAARDTAAYLDCDTGQATIGPPTTAGLALFSGDPPRLRQTILRFVGSTSPQGHLLQELVSTARLLDSARGIGVRYVIIDSPGWVRGSAAGEFQVRMIDLLNPDILVAIQEADELAGILANFRSRTGMTIRQLAPSSHALVRSRLWRARYRQERFRSYFAGHTGEEISLEGTGFHGKIPDSFRDDDWKNLLVALCDRDMRIISLAIVEKLDIPAGVLRVRVPPADLSQVSSVQVGSIKLEPGMEFRDYE
jgi:polynucleotide 5'-hydroxyl-kinase GRC3/NOL9